MGLAQARPNNRLRHTGVWSGNRSYEKTLVEVLRSHAESCEAMKVKLLCPNSKGVCALYFCGCVLIVTLWGMVHSSKRPITSLLHARPARLTHDLVFPTWPRRRVGSQDLFTVAVRKSVPSVHPKDKVILVWTKWYRHSEWPDLPAGMLPCAKHNINVSCRITYDKKEYERSDLVAFHGRGTDFGPNNLPDLSKRPPQQRWMYYNRESPVNQGLLANSSVGKKFNGLFNWTMTYKLDSDIDYRYSRIVPGEHPDEYHLKPTDKMAVAVISNCQSDRLHYVHELQKYIPVHLYGSCGTHRCPTRGDCFAMLKKNYSFYLSFENSLCKDYVTEKFYRNALMHNMLPVVINGGDFSNPTVAPPGCCIKASDFKSSKELAEHIKKVASNSTLYNSYFKWHSRYTVQGEFRGNVFCRTCQKLHTDWERKIYYDLHGWYGVKENCKSYPSP